MKLHPSVLNKFFVSAVVASVMLGACQNTPGSDPTTTTKSSFDLIQDKILTTNCALSGCHASAQDGTYRQHELVLAAGVAYDNLFNAKPKNADALTDNLLRVKPYKSLESLFYHKLSFDASHHGGKQYGAPMPLGGTPLYVGQIEFVRRWIEAGAPRTGSVADEALLDDKTPSYTENFEPLKTPTQEGLTGVQMYIEKFEVKPNFERELFVHKQVGNTQELYVNRIKLKSRVNTHHLVVYDFRDRKSLPVLNQVRDLRNADGTLNLLTVVTMSNHVFVGGGGNANYDYTLPEGTAILIPANYSFDLNPHYFNKGTTSIYGENYVNFYTVNKSTVQNVVQMLDLQNNDLSIPAKTRKTFTKSFTNLSSGRTAVVMLTSHMHKRGEKFVIKIKGGTRDGQVVYETTDWEHPLIKNFTPALILEKGEGLTSEITYYNETDKTVSFGLTSEDEMGIIFGYYYAVK
ncbi:MAG: hypothetical protein U0Y10_26790 [Spirosomataceae bacterium]